MIGITNLPKRYLVCDREKLLVYCEALSNNHAMALAQGLINGIVIATNNFSEVNLNDTSITYYYDSGEFKLYESPLDEKWKKERDLVLKRSEIFKMMQELVYKRLSRVDDHIGVGIMEGYIWSELNKCNPNEGYYTHAIEEWAHIAEVSVETAYQELLIRSESIGLVFLRTHATYLKYVNLVNQCKDIQEAEYQQKRFFDEIYKAANI